MNTRKKLISQLEAILNFNQFTVHTFREDEKVTKAIHQAKNLIDTALKETGSLPTELTFLSKQIAIYYLFYVRDKELAPRYVSIYKNLTVNNTQAYAEACNFLGHAGTIDPDYKIKDEFETALAISQQNGDSTNEAFASRYIALMFHRLNQLDKALAFIEKAIMLEQTLAESNPLMQIALAESLHIKGVILLKLADQQSKSQDRELQEKGGETLALAEKIFHEAAKWEKNFCSHLNNTHFLVLTTNQSLAQAQIRLGKGEEAIKLLQLTYDNQITYFKTLVHADIGKTLHFIGDAYLSLAQHEASLKAYLDTFVVKEKLYDANHIAITVTKQKLEECMLVLSPQLMTLVTTYNKEFPFDWNDENTFEACSKKAAAFTAFVKLILSKLTSDSEKIVMQELAELCYKLGTFHNHYTRDPEQALPLLNVALDFKKDNLWVLNHIAFSYQQKMFAAIKKNHLNITELFQAALTSLEPILKLSPINISQTKLVAFAQCVQGLIHYEMAKYLAQQPSQADLHYQSAVTGYSLACKLYENINAKDLQYARAKKCLAMILDEYSLLLKKADRLNEASACSQSASQIFQELELYWKENINEKSSIYAARFYSSYADFLQRSNNISDIEKAASLYEDAHKILSQKENPDSPFTQDVADQLTKVNQQLAAMRSNLRSIHGFHAQTKNIPSQNPSLVNAAQTQFQLNKM